MALATQCPYCKTSFKVAHDQLKLRSGLVRCGSCKQIFNGIEHLVPPDLPAVAPEKLPPTAPTNTNIPDVAVSSFVSQQPLPDKVPLSNINTLEFITADDPETQTRILPTEISLEPVVAPVIPPSEIEAPAAQTPAVKVDEDPMTRMTLIDFSSFNEDLVEDTGVGAPVTSQPTEAPPEPADEIWPNTQEGAGSTGSDAPQEAMMANAVDFSTIDLPSVNAFDETSDNEALAEDVVTDEIAKTDEATIVEGVDVAEEVETTSEDDELDAAIANAIDYEDEEPNFVKKGRRRQRWSRATRIAMVVFSLLLFLTAIGQAAYAFRDQLAARMPETKPVLTQLCDLIGCEVKLPAQIEQVSIESNALQAQANNSKVFTLNLLLRNRSATAQAWPHIELTLIDKDGKPIVRRALSPRDYLSSELVRAQGIPSKSEQTVSASFELNQLQASDYRVYLFYP